MPWAMIDRGIPYRERNHGSPSLPKRRQRLNLYSQVACGDAKYYALRHKLHNAQREPQKSQLRHGREGFVNLLRRKQVLGDGACGQSGQSAVSLKRERPLPPLS